MTGMLTAQEKHLMAVMWNQLSKPLNPAALEGQDAPLTPEHSSVTVPYVSQETGD